MGAGEVRRSTDEAQPIRSRLVAIADELRIVAADDFATKHRLNVEADELRRRLEQLADGDSETLHRWADRAARKGSHEMDHEREAAKAAIVSPTEGGAPN